MATERHVNIEHPLVNLEGMRVSWGGICLRKAHSFGW
jgi:hypothetical protein